MSETKHTPGPWRVDPTPNAGDKFAIVARDEDYSEITQGDAYYEREQPICYFSSVVDHQANTYHNNPKDEANAAYIVRACNAHEDLVTALKEIFDLLEEHQPKWYLKGHYNRARAALEKAKE